MFFFLFVLLSRLAVGFCMYSGRTQTRWYIDILYPQKLSSVGPVHAFNPRSMLTPACTGKENLHVLCLARIPAFVRRLACHLRYPCPIRHWKERMEEGRIKRETSLVSAMSGKGQFRVWWIVGWVRQLGRYWRLKCGVGRCE